MQQEVILGVSDFVALLNQTLEFAYPSVSIVGELANFKVSKNRWVYCDLKDEFSSVKFFGTVYQLSGPLEDGLMMQVRGLPRLHNQFGFSVNVQAMSPVGEGSLKKAANLLQAKLEAEGLFDPLRKRPLPYPPQTIGLVTSGESAAYHDFIKILNDRWSGVRVFLADVQVQGESAPAQIVEAINYFNTHAEPVDVLVVTRGGGSADDLAAFSTEQVTRAIAGSRIPTIVAIGHEVDVSLAELAADQRASTPSNAAQLLVPDKRSVLESLNSYQANVAQALGSKLADSQKDLLVVSQELHGLVSRLLDQKTNNLTSLEKSLRLVNPKSILKRGYSIVRTVDGKVVKDSAQLKTDQQIKIELGKGGAHARVL